MKSTSHTFCVWLIRILIIIFFITSIIYNERSDNLIQFIWNYLRKTKFVKHDSFEPILSVIAFFIFINGFRILDQYCPSIHKYKLNYSSNKPIKIANDYFFGMGYEFMAVFWYLFPICFYDIIYPRRKLPINGPSWIEVITHLSFGIFLYDFIFYWIHLSLHKFKYLYKLHGRHHEWKGKCLRASETVRHSFIDATMQVTTNIIVQNIGNKHPFIRLLHNIFIIYFLVETHSGYDLPWFLHNICPYLFGGSIRHNIHHQRGDVYFHQFFKYLDDWFGFVPSSSSSSSLKKKKSIIIKQTGNN